MKKFNKNILLGTAQFSDNYGLQNNSNIFTQKVKILDKVIRYNCHGIDTAINYEKAQVYIGKWLEKNKYNTKIVTKINGSENLKEMNSSFDKCLYQLKIDKIDGLLFHNQKSWKFKETKLLAKNLLRSNKIKAIGISIYDEYAIPDNKLNFIQIPGNLFNQKILRSRKLQKFIKKGGEVHVRSIFIQGLLLMNPDDIPNYLKKLYTPLKEFHLLCSKTNYNPISLATQCIRKFIPDFKLVIGVDTPEQFDEIIEKINIKIDQKTLDKAIAIGEKYSDDLWDPRNWNTN